MTDIGPIESEMRNRARDIRSRFFARSDNDNAPVDRTVHAPQHAFEGKMRDRVKSPYADKSFRPNWRPIGELLNNIILDLPKQK